MKTLYHWMNRISNRLSKVLVWLIILLVVACTATVFLQVVNRYVIVKISDVSFSFTDELSRWLMIVITYLTIGLCVREASMAQVDLIYKRLGKRARLVLYFITRALMAVVLYIAIYYGLRIMEMRAFMSSSMLSIPGRVLYAPPVIGAVLMTYEWLTEMVGVIAGELEPFDAGNVRGFPEHNEPAEEMPVIGEDGSNEASEW